MSAANKEQTEAADDRVYTLRRPLIFEEKTYTNLLLDFDMLSGDDLISIDRRFIAETAGQSVGYVKEFNKEFQAYVVAAASGHPIELIKKLSLKDLSAVTLRAQNFLLL